MIFRKGKWKGLGPLSALCALTLERSRDDEHELAAIVGIHLRKVLEQVDPGGFKDPAQRAALVALLQDDGDGKDLDVSRLAGPGRARLRAFVFELLHEMWFDQDNIGARDEALFVQMVAVELVRVLKCEDQWEVLGGA